MGGGGSGGYGTPKFHKEWKNVTCMCSNKRPFRTSYIYLDPPPPPHSLPPSPFKKILYLILILIPQN